MPLYEYKCENCGDLFEVMQKFADEPLKVHEKCGGTAVRLISVPSLQFKGSGFYITDYGKSGTKAAGENGSSQKSDSAGTKTGTSSESGSNTTSSSESKSSSSDTKSTSGTSSKSSSSDTK